MFRGSRTIDASQFSDITAITGGSYNADTQNEITQYFFEIPPSISTSRSTSSVRARTGILDSQSGWERRARRDHAGGHARQLERVVSAAT